jgi:hypothetical protein
MINLNEIDLDKNYDRQTTTAGILANNKVFFKDYYAHFIINNQVYIIDGDAFGENTFGAFATINNVRSGISSNTEVELRKKV